MTQDYHFLICAFQIKFLFIGVYFGRNFTFLFLGDSAKACYTPMVPNMLLNHLTDPFNHRLSVASFSLLLVIIYSYY